MAFVPIRIDRTSKPPLGTPLRSDGHWCLQNNNRFYALNEFCSASIFDNLGVVSVAQTPDNFTWTTNGLRRISGIGNLGILRSSTSAFTWAICGSFASISAVSRRLFQCGSGTYLSFGNGSVTLSCNGLSSAATGSVSTVNNKEYTIFCIYDGVSLSVVVNDVVVSNQVVTGTFTFQAGSFNFSGDSYYNGTIGTYIWVATWNTGLPLDLCRRISANPWQAYEPETVWIEVGGGGEIFSGSFSASIENLIQSGFGQIGCGGGMSANAGSATYSMGGLEGKQGDLSINISDLLQLLSGNSGNVANLQSTITALPFLLSGNSGNSANFNSQLLSLTQSLNGQHGVSAALVASIGNLSAMFGEQVVFQGTVSAVTATFVSSLSGITGNIGQALASISVASALSGITGNIGLLQGILNQISGQLIGNVGISGSAVMSIYTGAEMVGKLGVSASMASELADMRAYLVEIIIGGKIHRIVISTKTGSAVILTATGKINITTN